MKKIFLILSLFILTSCGTQKDHIVNIGEPLNSNIPTLPDIKKEDDKNLLNENNNKEENIKKENLIKVELYSDLLCSACISYWPTIKEIKNEYKNKIDFVFYNYPLSYLKNSEKLSIYSLCADEQGFYFDFINGIFSAEGNVDNDFVNNLNQELGLNIENFTKCTESEKIKNQIIKDKEVGKKRGVYEVPTLFINNKKFKGLRTYDFIKNEIEKVL